MDLKTRGGRWKAAIAAFFAIEFLGLALGVGFWYYFTHIRSADMETGIWDMAEISLAASLMASSVICSLILVSDETN